MTKAATATRKSMRPVRKSEAQGTATTRKPKPTPVTLDVLVANAIAEFGTPDAAIKGIEAAHAAAAAADKAVTVWARIAEQWVKEGRSARAFAEAVNGNPNTLGRLRSVNVLVHASTKGTGTRRLTPVEAVKVANSRTIKAVDALAAEMLDGKDPLGTKATRPGAIKPNSTKTAAGQGSTKARNATATTVSEATMLGLLESMLRIAPSVKDGKVAVEAARVASALAADLTKRAAVLAAPVKGTRKVTAA